MSLRVRSVRNQQAANASGWHSSDVRNGGSTRRYKWCKHWPSELTLGRSLRTGGNACDTSGALASRSAACIGTAVRLVTWWPSLPITGVFNVPVGVHGPQVNGGRHCRAVTFTAPYPAPPLWWPLIEGNCMSILRAGPLHSAVGRICHGGEIMPCPCRTLTFTIQRFINRAVK